MGNVENLQDEILIILSDQILRYPAKLSIGFESLLSELRKIKRYSDLRSDILERDARAAAINLLNEGFLKTIFSPTGRFGVLTLSPDGLIALQDYTKSRSENEEDRGAGSLSFFEKSDVNAPPIPMTLDNLLDYNLECLIPLKRYDEIFRIKHFFNDSMKGHVLIYYGLPQLGKTTVLQNLSIATKKPFLPIYVNLQNCSQIDLESFLLELIEEISSDLDTRFRGDESINLLPLPTIDQAQIGIRTEIFIDYWSHFLEENPAWKPILILDEIDELTKSFDTNAAILEFLIEFLDNPNNGFFILVGHENIFRLTEKSFVDLLAIGFPIQIGTMPHGTIEGVLSILKEHYKIPEIVSQEILMLCDEHPIISRRFLDQLLSKLVENQKVEIYWDDIEGAKDAVINESQLSLASLYRDLSDGEQKLLLDLSTKYRVEPSFNYKSEELTHHTHALVNFEKRGWVTWKNNHEFVFSFVLLLGWLSSHLKLEA